MMRKVKLYYVIVAHRLLTTPTLTLSDAMYTTVYISILQFFTNKYQG